MFFGYIIGTEEERDIQKSYWMEHSSDLTVEAMMLDSKASDLDKEERPEVCLYMFVSQSCEWLDFLLTLNDLSL